MRALLILVIAFSAPAFGSGKTVLVGDSHMAGALGDALVPLLGGPSVARRYGIVSASAEMTYTTNAAVKNICPSGCTAVCPANAACPFTLGYRRPQDKALQSGRVPTNFPRITGILEEEKEGLSRVILELGTNDANLFGCSDAGVTKMGALLDQVKAAQGKPRCAFIGPPPYLEGSPIFARCGASYNTFVDKLLALARAKGCQAVDSRKAREGNGPMKCLVGGLHCTPAQAAVWASTVMSQLTP